MASEARMLTWCTPSFSPFSWYKKVHVYVHQITINTISYHIFLTRVCHAISTPRNRVFASCRFGLARLSSIQNRILDHSICMEPQYLQCVLYNFTLLLKYVFCCFPVLCYQRHAGWQLTRPKTVERVFANSEILFIQTCENNSKQKGFRKKAPAGTSSMLIRRYAMYVR